MALWQNDLSPEVLEKGKKARLAALALANCKTTDKNTALLAMAAALRANTDEIISANKKDVAAGLANSMPNALVDRLSITEKRIVEMANGLHEVAALPDPIGEVLEGWTRPNGLRIQKVRVPLGVVGIIYEARPNVTADAAGLCLKSGNAVILRGGKEALNSNRAIVDVMMTAAEKCGAPAGAVQLIENPDREVATAMMRANGLIDVLIPRGGAGLIQSVLQNATVPVIETGVGNCHLYLDATADKKMATAICINAKVQRPSVCNAIETLLVHEALGESYLVELLAELNRLGVEIRGCERTVAAFSKAQLATEADWEEEFLRLVLAVRVVNSLDETLAHIQRYSSKHSEAIVTQDLMAAERFTRELDAAAVYVNASTRFTDGYEFGFGAEIGISTQKLHARGPMGLRELTSSKYIIRGEGQIRS
ncbi:MAG: Gamma-glutamyl phosphate reductase [bacterium]|nr:Gamma-glutamyl phosphate reductase [bacterium]